MKFTLLIIGKTNQDFIQEGIGLYKKRVERYIPFKIMTVPEIKKSVNLNQDDVKMKEAKSVLKKVPAPELLILLDEKGHHYNSKEFARFLEKQMISCPKNITFLIGGAYGFSSELYKRSDYIISLSKMTFSHQLACLIFMEQFYRAFTIIRGEPYHHG